jgi:hypothetical protein
MNRRPTVEELEQFVAGELPPERERALREAAEASPTLQGRIDALRRERQTMESLRGSAHIRQPDAEEEQIVARVYRRLSHTLNERRTDRPGDS